jgi:hypothetical protein
LRNTELAKIEAHLEGKKQDSIWAVDIHTCQQRQQEAGIMRQGSSKRGKLNLNAD